MTYKMHNNSETIVEALVRGISHELCSGRMENLGNDSETIVEALVRGISHELCSGGRRTY